MTTRMLGVHENAKPEVTTARFPGVEWERLFISDSGKPLPVGLPGDKLIKMVLAEIRDWTAAGKGVTLSVKLDMDEVRRGLWDARLAQLAKAVEAFRLILVVSHEQENDTKAKVSLDGSNRAYDVIKAAAPGLLYATADLTYAWSLKLAGADVRVSAADAKLRAKRKADIHLADTYFGKTFPMGILPEHDGWARWFDLMAPDRWGMGEIGWLKGPLRPACIDRQTEWFATDPIGVTCEVVTVWGTGGTEANPGWVYDDEPSAAAVARMMARLSLPFGYEPGPLPGVLVHSATGLLVMVDRTDKLDSFTSGR